MLGLNCTCGELIYTKMFKIVCSFPSDKYHTKFTHLKLLQQVPIVPVLLFPQ